MNRQPPVSTGLEVSPEWWSRLGHDLRGPISPMRMGLQMLKSGRVSAAEQAEALLLIDRQLDQLLATIEDISELLRMNAPGFALNFTVDDLNLVVDALSGRSSLRRMLDDKGQRLQCSAAAAPVAARHDPQRLVLLLEYLIGKAADHAPRGSSLSLRLSEGSDGAEFRFSGAGVPLLDDPDLAHIAALDMSRCDERQARALRMREIARLGGAVLELPGDGAWTLRLPRRSPP